MARVWTPLTLDPAPIRHRDPVPRRVRAQAPPRATDAAPAVELHRHVTELAAIAAPASDQTSVEDHGAPEPGPEREHHEGGRATGEPVAPFPEGQGVHVVVDERVDPGLRPDQLDQRPLRELRQLDDARSQRARVDVHDARQAHADPLDLKASRLGSQEQLAERAQQGVQSRAGAIAVWRRLDHGQDGAVGGDEPAGHGGAPDVHPDEHARCRSHVWPILEPWQGECQRRGQARRGLGRGECKAALHLSAVPAVRRSRRRALTSYERSAGSALRPQAQDDRALASTVDRGA